MPESNTAREIIAPATGLVLAAQGVSRIVGTRLAEAPFRDIDIQNWRGEITVRSADANTTEQP